MSDGKVYSARLRFQSDESKVRHADKVQRKLELTNLADSLVGSEEEGGLTFEQRKRLSVAIELAASLSIIFRYEPLKRLDARANVIVVRVLRPVTDSGRTVVATIHQPSLTLFEMFDELTLLEKVAGLLSLANLVQAVHL